MTTVMDLEDAKDDAADADELCDAVCPFNIQYCMDMCKRLMEAVGMPSASNPPWHASILAGRF